MAAAGTVAGSVGVVGVVAGVAMAAGVVMADAVLAGGAALPLASHARIHGLRAVVSAVSSRPREGDTESADRYI